MKRTKTGSSADARTRRLAWDAALLGAALILSYVEAIFPLPLIPLPGFKLGLANLAVLLAAFHQALPDAAAISLCRIFLTFFLFGSPTAFLFSLSGGLCVLLLLTLLKTTRLAQAFSFIGMSVLCAAAHNAGQLLAAVFLTGRAALAYLPALTIASLLCGSITGIVLNLLSAALLKASNRGTA